MLITRFPGPALRRGHTWQKNSETKQFLQKNKQWFWWQNTFELTYRDLVCVGGARAPTIILPPIPPIPPSSFHLTTRSPSLTQSVGHLKVPLESDFFLQLILPANQPDTHNLKLFYKESDLFHQKCPPTNHPSKTSICIWKFYKESFFWLHQSKTSHPHNFRTTSSMSLSGNLQSENLKGCLSFFCHCILQLLVWCKLSKH